MMLSQLPHCLTGDDGPGQLTSFGHTQEHDSGKYLKSGKHLWDQISLKMRERGFDRYAHHVYRQVEELVERVPGSKEGADVVGVDYAVMFDAFKFQVYMPSPVPPSLLIEMVLQWSLTSNSSYIKFGLKFSTLKIVATSIDVDSKDKNAASFHYWLDPHDSRPSSLPPEPGACGDDSKVDIPFDNTTDWRANVRDLEANEAELNKWEEVFLLSLHMLVTSIFYIYSMNFQSKYF
ncbi:hypothetical protein L2E82_43420 [Cichorium intybus]|uniref:Uncharacterized protein n=1 Tax=Cichorium intybus TaxID=13427 RepID=A0ACB8ZMM1_CICIN|nr:hypothetical protein L2E82_43420 [Cichorium intybus]